MGTAKQPQPADQCFMPAVAASQTASTAAGFLQLRHSLPILWRSGRSEHMGAPLQILWAHLEGAPHGQQGPSLH